MSRWLPKNRDKFYQVAETTETKPTTQIKEVVKDVAEMQPKEGESATLNIINTNDNVLTRNKDLIYWLCNNHWDYKFCVSAFEKIFRRETSHLTSKRQLANYNYWNIHCTPSWENKGRECERIGSEMVRIYKNEKEGIVEWYNTILNGVYYECNTFSCMHKLWYATDPNWSRWVGGVKVKSLNYLLTMK